MSDMKEAAPASPAAPAAYDKVVLAHGGGGDLTRRLIAEHVLPRLGNRFLEPLGDSAVLARMRGRPCLTTDAFVVQPLRFPGGDIGRLAVCGTINDLSVMGATPRALSLALVLEEGLPLAVLDEVLDSIAAAVREAGVPVVTGDTKVVERGRGDGMTITTAGVGELPDRIWLGTDRIRAGDALVVTGRVAEHGLAVMAAREGLGLTTDLRSDVAPLNGLVRKVLAARADVKFMRDPTRGGLAAVLADLCEATGLGLEVREDQIPLSPGARHAAEALGLDPLTVANEGKVVIVTRGRDGDRVVEVCRRHPLGADAAVIGRFVTAQPPLVELVCRSGGRRIVQRPYGEELPRIC